MSMECLDYGASLICHPPESFNAVRFAVESRARIISPGTGEFRDYYQCASCKSENTFEGRPLFKAENYDFLPVVGPEGLLIFRRHAYCTEHYRESCGFKSAWGAPVMKLSAPGVVQSLPDGASIVRATLAGLPIVARTEIASEKTGMKAVIEYPVKTMNANSETNSWQIDTGPVLFPDLESDYEREIERFSLAFIALCDFEYAEFVTEQSVAILKDGEEAARVYHYSGPVGFSAKNELFALGGKF